MSRPTLTAHISLSVVSRRRITVEIDGASDALYARLDNDICARPSDPPPGVEIEVLTDGDVSLSRQARQI